MLCADAVFERRLRERIAQRMGESLQASATIERGDLALIRGSLELSGIAVRRDDVVGHIAITVPSLTCALPPLGLALIHSDCRDLALRDARFELSSAALFKLPRPKRPPLHVDRITIDGARLELLPSAIVPDLGRITIAIAHADAGATTFKTPLSWLFALRELRATVELPAGITLSLTYDRGELRVAGGMFGATPIALPVALPVVDISDDPRAELAKLVDFAKDVAARLVTRKAESWLRSLSSP
jgi:hypothetical protein